MPCCIELRVYSACDLPGSNENNELFDVPLNKIQTLFPHLHPMGLLWKLLTSSGYGSVGKPLLYASMRTCALFPGPT